MLNKKNYIIFYKIYSSLIHIFDTLPILLSSITMNNGSLTQNLNSITGNNININILYQKFNNNNKLTRKVLIQYNKLPAIFAISNWLSSNLNFNHIVNNQPLGQSIIKNEIDTHKKIQNFYYGYNYTIEKKLCHLTPIYCREYTLYHNQKPLAKMKEFFTINILNNLNTDNVSIPNR